MKTNVKRFLNLMVLLFLTTSMSAQEPQTFSLAAAQQYAMQHSFLIRNAGLDVEIARKKVWETITIGLPKIDGSASYSNFLNLPVSLIPGQFFGEEEGTYIPVKFGQDYSSDFGFTVNQLIFDGSYIVGVGSAKIYLQMATESKEKTEIEIRYAVAQAYYLTLIAEENLAVMRENLDNSKKLKTDAEAMYKNGFAEEQDVDQMLLLVKKAENEVLKAEREIRVSKMVLKYAIGLDVEKEVALSDKLEQFVAPLLAEDHQLGGFDFAGHIDYRMIDTQRQISQKLLKLEQAAFLPRISGFYNWNKTAYGNSANLYKSTVPWFRSSLWGINVTVPIFSSGERVLKVNQAKMDYEKVLNQQKLAEQTLQKDYLTAVADLENAVDQLKNTVDNKMLARKILDKTTIKYNNGISSSTELQQTESQYIQSQGAWVASMMQLLSSKINLEKSIGK